MPKKVTTDTETSETPRNLLPYEGMSADEKLSMMVMYLHRMDRRDRVRTIGSSIKTLIALASFALIFWSTWYFIAHGPELMEQITRQAIEQSAEYSEQTMMDRLQQYME